MYVPSFGITAYTDATGYEKNEQRFNSATKDEHTQGTFKLQEGTVTHYESGHAVTKKIIKIDYVN